MKTTKTIPSAAAAAAAAFDVFGAGHEIAPRGPAASALMGKLGKAVTHATEWVTGTDPELARTRFLAQATDLADLERRISAWERA